MSKYEPLRTYLREKGSEAVPMTFREIEKILGFRLPDSQRYPAWWSNNPTNNVMTNEWLAAGYRTEQVDTEGGKVVFRRTSPGAKSPPAGSAPDTEGSGRHAFYGWMKGMITIAPGTDLTKPADPDWGDIAWGDSTLGKTKDGSR